MDKLPKGWENKKLIDCIELINGRAYKQEELLDAGTPVLRIQNLNGGSNWYYSNLELPKKNYCYAGELLFAWSASFGPYIWSGEKAIFHYHIWKVISKQNINEKFAYYFLEHFTKEVRNHTVGVAMFHITKSKMEQIPIYLPPLPEQIRIVSKLDTLFGRIDKSIALLEENIKHTNGLTASVLEEIFVDGKNWERQPLNQVAKVERGKSKHRPRNDQKLFGDSYPFIQTGDVRSANKYIDKYEVCYSEFGLKQSRLWNKGTICLTIAANIGDVAILGFDACFPDSVVGITPNSMNNEFLYYYLKTLQLQLDKKANSAAQKNINLKILSEIDVPVPSIEIQNSIADRFSRLEEKQFQILSVQQSKLNYLKALKSSLLDRAFKGEL
ncbi:type I restriction-modification system, specificity subunit S [Aquipluma nitroreducens]|uniref:Type I restriction-modification system, specificity subunit S n=1 Tax=Aquipluma nitroreducens TaxID=2010828 RepID=A0A5K7SEY9_9BACT|nr:restriction endonuclease subunit S [Aquipluma nitroreducens]BBE19814.1 type I restriction-modification system, specificity subunit S [Aquipluma nitroreducens]